MPDVTTESIDSPFATGAPGSLDSSFGGGDGVVTQSGSVGGNYDDARVLAFDSAGNIYAAGVSFDGTYDRAVLYRYFEDGSLDTAFGGVGYVNTLHSDGALGHDAAWGLAVDGADQPVMVGSSTPTSSPQTASSIVWRFTTAGALDTVLAGDGIIASQDSVAGGDVGEGASSVTIDGSGRILVSGSSRSASGIDFVMWRYSAVGAPDGSFGISGVSSDGSGGGQNGGQQVLVHPSGDIYVGGYCCNNRPSVWRWATGGTSISRLDPTILAAAEQANAMILDSAGRLVTAGFANYSPEVITLWRYTTPPLAPDATWGTGGRLEPPDIVPNQAASAGNAIVMDSNTGTYVVAGYVRDSGGNLSMAIWRFLSSGDLDPTFGNGGGVAYRNLISSFTPTSELAYTLRIDNQGRYVVVGRGQDSGGQYRLVMLRINP